MDSAEILAMDWFNRAFFEREARQYKRYLKMKKQASA